jgi:hypothetical protein
MLLPLFIAVFTEVQTASGVPLVMIGTSATKTDRSFAFLWLPTPNRSDRNVVLGTGTVYQRSLFVYIWSPVL